MNVVNIVRLAAWKAVGDVEQHVADPPVALVCRTGPAIRYRNLQEALNVLAKPSRHV